MRGLTGEEITLWVMVVIGAGFWIGALFVPGLTWWMIVFSAVVIAWCGYWLMLIREEKKGQSDSESN